ncbi:MAG: UvrD-helicase domain-containing protein, partial [Parcubacteria group bacterium]
MSTGIQQTIELRRAASAKSTLRDLTPAQAAAVTHGRDPLLIIAGAGTGKTMVITRRLAYLLQDRKISGDKILAITFSNKATEEMETRLDQLMPIGFEGPWINTFHSFGERILRQEAFAIGLDPAFTILTTPQQHLLVRRNFDKFELDYYRPSSNPTKFISALLQHFSRAKDEAVLPKAYIAWAEQQLKQLQKKSYTPAEFEEAQRQLEVARAYQTYQELLRDQGALDLADLIVKPLELFNRR